MKIKDLNYISGRGYIFYEVASERFEEGGNRKVDEAFRCATYEEAKSEAESMKLDVGYSAVIYAIYLSNVTKEAEEVEFDDIEEIFDEYFEDLDIEFDEYVKTEEGKNIEGAVVIKWQWSKYVGYSRNFVDVGIAGQYPYHNILKEIDLITGDEDRVFRTNYSVLATKEELEEHGTEVLLRKMIEGDWKWNNVQDVSDTMARFVTEDLKDYTDRAMFNRIYQGYHLGKMVDEEGSITHEGFECEWKSRVRIREEYREDLRRLIEKGILSNDIVEDMLELDYQKVMEVLSKIKKNYER
jgi:hypothetical protein